ncbi:7-carboxy-7-deazaguanine synthase QueE [Thioalkalivibrio sp. XN279]|uniref:7-carboxy-7-deazaguanine synthase QueE n=1 Tax=Thioalkalivibrio sp. XN279 TaxID=2714953 RepID=UPI00140E297F|nr:7-carboxy-7-deazaguanine synthase QueE [Thioalkalivibrio sp. XN279]NHA14369.1 7-carboxy-7-deazaguanine synthase QueE [Thioalkalivibrio sp. XN279]
MSAASEEAVRAEAALRITEIFLSVQGEASSVGWPTVFVRLTGCPLRCTYCDTAYAFHGGERLSLDEILARVAGHGVRHVCVTGGEPLAQRACLDLVTRLCDAGYAVSVETSGALDIGGLDPRAQRVMDVKTPASGESARNLPTNLDALRRQDCAKFVVCDRADYDWARQFVSEHGLATRCEVLFSPCWGRVAPAALAEWILADRLPVRFQLQLHKVLWGDVPGR